MSVALCVGVCPSACVCVGEAYVLSYVGRWLWSGMLSVTMLVSVLIEDLLY